MWYLYVEDCLGMDTTRVSLLLRIKNQRDAEAWAEFDAIYRPILRRYAKAWRLPEEEMQDVVQQCMLAIHKHIAGFDYDPKKGRFRAWLKTIVCNRVKNLLRDRREKPADSGDFKREQTREPTPEEEFERIWMEEHLKHALEFVRGEVDGPSFEAFQRYVIEEKPVKTVCDEFGTSAAQLYKIKWRLTQKLRRKMTELTGEEA